jgi:hypothetical protein
MPSLIKGYSYSYRVGLERIPGGFLLRQVAIS